MKAGPQYASEITLPSTDYVTDSNNDEMHFVASPSVLEIGTTANPAQVDSINAWVKQQNIANGFAVPETASAQSSPEATADKQLSKFEQFIKDTFGEDRERTQHQLTGNIGVIKVCLSQQPEPGEKVVLNTVHKTGDQSIFLTQGDRFEFTSENWNKPAYITIQVDPKLKEASSASFESTSGNISLAWSITFFVLAGFFIAICLYHKYILPKPKSDKAVCEATASNIFKEFFATFVTFFQKKQVWVAVLFMLLYRLPEAQLVKLINPFLLDPRELGGLGLTTGQVGLVYGTIGILGLTIGGIIGGIVAAKGGLKKWLWPMAWSISLTCITFVYLSYYQPESFFIINLCVFIEQFGYGFGFTAYMLYLIYFSDGEHKTAHYAICTAFMALGMMLPGMAAGWLQELIGYKHFFYWVMICCAATIAVCAFIKIDPNYGKKENEEKEIETK